MSVSGLRHEAFLYDSDEEFVGTMATFLEAGVEEGAAALAVTTRSNCALLRDELGATAKSVAFVDRDDWFVRPATTIAAYHSTFSEFVRGGAPSIRVVGEIQFGPTTEEWREWTAYEAILNRALAEHPAWIVCPYDLRTLPEQVLDGASQTHPTVLSEGGQTSGGFAEPEDVVRNMLPAREPLEGLRRLSPGDSPMLLRERLAAELAAAKVPESKALNMLLAANEVAVNAFEHGGGPEALRVGLVGGRFVCEISDRGPGLADPLAGFVPPKPGNGGGTGLWTARQLISRVELIPSDDGLTVRLWV
ncbi:MAG: anti-sigma factor RsbA family regulatory protein [Solirubrobacteraceae bacterium]